MHFAEFGVVMMLFLIGLERTGTAVETPQIDPWIRRLQVV
jgi:hypothetical protein